MEAFQIAVGCPAANVHNTTTTIGECLQEERVQQYERIEVQLHVVGDQGRVIDLRSVHIAGAQRCGILDQIGRICLK